MIDPMPTERVVVDREFPCSSLNRRTRSEQPFDPHPAFESAPARGGCIPDSVLSEKPFSRAIGFPR